MSVETSNDEYVADESMDDPLINDDGGAELEQGNDDDGNDSGAALPDDGSSNFLLYDESAAPPDEKSSASIASGAARDGETFLTGLRQCASAELASARSSLCHDNGGAAEKTEALLALVVSIYGPGDGEGNDSSGSGATDQPQQQQQQPSDDRLDLTAALTESRAAVAAALGGAHGEARAALEADLGTYVDALPSRRGGDGAPLLEGASRAEVLAAAEKLLAAARREYRAFDGWAGPRRFDQLPIAADSAAAGGSGTGSLLKMDASDPKIAESLTRVQELDAKLRDVAIASRAAAREADPEGYAGAERRRAEARSARLDAALRAEREKRARLSKLTAALRSLDDGGGGGAAAGSGFTAADEALVRAVVAREDDALEAGNPFVVNTLLATALATPAFPLGATSADAASSSACVAEPDASGAAADDDLASLRARLAEIDARLVEFAIDDDGDCGGNDDDVDSVSGRGCSASGCSSVSSLLASARSAALLASALPPGAHDNGSVVVSGTNTSKASNTIAVAAPASVAASSRSSTTASRRTGMSKRSSSTSGGPRSNSAGAVASRTPGKTTTKTKEAAAAPLPSSVAGGGASASGAGVSPSIANGNTDYLRAMREQRALAERDRAIDARLRELRAGGGGGDAAGPLAPDVLRALLAECTRAEERRRAVAAAAATVAVAAM